MPVSRERQFIRPATMHEQRAPALDPHVEAAPLPGRVASPSSTRRSASGGSRVSACRNSSTSPLAAAAPAFICAPRPRGAAITRSASGARQLHGAVAAAAIDHDHLGAARAKRRQRGQRRRDAGRLVEHRDDDGELTASGHRVDASLRRLLSARRRSSSLGRRCSRSNGRRRGSGCRRCRRRADRTDAPGCAPPRAIGRSSIWLKSQS